MTGTKWAIWLAACGIAVTIIVGVAPIDELSVGYRIIIWVATLGCLAIYPTVEIHLERPPFTMLRTVKTLDFKSQTTALFTYEYTCQANHSNTREISHDNICTETAGKIQNVKWLGAPVRENQISRWGSLYKINIPLNPPRQRFEKFDGSLAWEFVDSFPDSHEGTAHRVMFRERDLTIKIKFPNECVFENPRATLERGAQILNIQDQLLSNGKEITLRVKDTKVGERYVVEWDWRWDVETRQTAQ